MIQKKLLGEGRAVPPQTHLRPNTPRQIADIEMSSQHRGGLGWDLWNMYGCNDKLHRTSAILRMFQEGWITHFHLISTCVGVSGLHSWKCLWGWCTELCVVLDFYNFFPEQNVLRNSSSLFTVNAGTKERFFSVTTVENYSTKEFLLLSGTGYVQPDRKIETVVLHTETEDSHLRCKK